MWNHRGGTPAADSESTFEEARLSREMAKELEEAATLRPRDDRAPELELCVAEESDGGCLGTTRKW